MLARNKLLVKWFLYAVAAAACLLVQTALLQRFTVWGVIPFLYPLLAAIPATRESPVAGAAFALCVGVACDLLLPGAVPCLYTLTFPLAGLCAGLLAQSVLPAGYFCSLVSSAAANCWSYQCIGVRTVGRDMEFRSGERHAHLYLVMSLKRLMKS